MMVATLMRWMGIETEYRRLNTSKLAPDRRVYLYLLRSIAIMRSNHAWAMDISSIPIARGLIYLPAMIDWFGRRILAWKLSIVQEVGFCIAAVEDALARHGRSEIFNSEQGSQFTSSDFSPLLLESKIARSMDGKVAWLGKVIVERLWHSAKCEEVYLQAYASVPEARAGLGFHLNIFNGRAHIPASAACTPDQGYFTQAPLLAAP